LNLSEKSQGNKETILWREKEALGVMKEDRTTEKNGETEKQQRKVGNSLRLQSCFLGQG
jgi:hypothetical protein